MSLIHTLDRVLYSNFKDHWDDWLFRERVIDVIQHWTCRNILDLGAGSGRLKQMDFRQLAARVCGVDPNPAVLENPFLDEARVGDGIAIPYADESFDLVFANNVLEHLTDPLRVFCEIRRVLRPGGFFLAKTPNKWHYVGIVSRLTPHWFHIWFNARRGRSEKDTYPTKYLANTPAALGRLSKAAGLDLQSLELIEGRPEYLRFAVVPYLLGALYERTVNRFSALRNFRVLLIMTARRPLS